MSFWMDIPRPQGDLVARFEEDDLRGALYLLVPEPVQILAMVRVYTRSEWPDVGQDEVQVQWDPSGKRCIVTVRGRRRHIDVQQDQQEAA